jgi:hypothetical protein
MYSPTSSSRYSIINVVNFPSAKPNDEEALQVYVDRLHAENPSSRVYKAEDDVTEAIAEYLDSKRLEAS